MEHRFTQMALNALHAFRAGITQDPPPEPPMALGGGVLNGTELESVPGPFKALKVHHTSEGFVRWAKAKAPAQTPGAAPGIAVRSAATSRS